MSLSSGDVFGNGRKNQTAELARAFGGGKGLL